MCKCIVCVISQNLYDDGITAVAGDLTDSPAALACTLITLVHNFDMNTLGSISNWMNLIANEVDDLAVSKHSSHVSYLPPCYIVHVHSIA
jgi:hypothetical protein